MVCLMRYDGVLALHFDRFPYRTGEELLDFVADCLTTRDLHVLVTCGREVVFRASRSSPIGPFAITHLALYRWAGEIARFKDLSKVTHLVIPPKAPAVTHCEWPEALERVDVRGLLTTPWVGVAARARRLRVQRYDGPLVRLGAGDVELQEWHAPSYVDTKVPSNVRVSVMVADARLDAPALWDVVEALRPREVRCSPAQFRNAVSVPPNVAVVTTGAFPTQYRNRVMVAPQGVLPQPAFKLSKVVYRAVTPLDDLDLALLARVRAYKLVVAFESEGSYSEPLKPEGVGVLLLRTR